MKATVRLYYRTKIDSPNGGYRMEPIVFKKGRAVPPENPTGSYYLRYSANGKRHMEPTETADLAGALIAYERKAQELDNASRGLGALNIKPEPVAHGEKTLQQAMDEFLAQAQNKGRRTRETYEAEIRLFINHCGPANLLAKTGRPCALSYRDWLYQQDISETTRVNKMTIVKIFLNHFGISGVYKKGEWPKPNKRVPDAYSQAEIKALLNACRTNEETLLIKLALFSGARRGEIAHLAKSDIQIRKNGRTEIAVVAIKEKPEFGWNTKGKRDRKVRLPLDFAKELLSARAGYKPSDLLFPNSHGQPNEKHLDRIIRPVAERAGIDVTGKIFHKFRRTYATMKSNHTNPQTLQKELGHQNIQTTTKYLSAADVESEEVGKATDKAFGDLVNL